jgi:putative ABC transport system permease protein
MSLWKVAWRSIRQRTLVSLLTVLSMGLGVALVVGVLVVYGVVEKSFQHGGEGYDLIVGAKGGKEQLVLNTVFYLNQPVGNIPYSFYEELTDGKYGPVEAAIPVCMGHTYRGFRVVGTTPEMFTDLKYGRDESYQFAKGENFKQENHLDAVIGSIAAYRTQLQVGEKFQAVHGSNEGGPVHAQTFNIVGILAPTGTPVDRAVFVNMAGFQDIHKKEAALTGLGEKDQHDEKTETKHDEKAEKKRDEKADKKPNDEKAEKHDSKDAKNDHADEAGHEAHDEKNPNHDHSKCTDDHSEITAVLVCIPRKIADRGMTDIMSKLINNSKVAQAVIPVKVITDLFEGIVGKLQWVLLGMAVLTVVEAGIGIMVSIYNSMSDRRHEIAVMRALGASRVTVMLIILMESILLSLMGGAFGLLLGHGAIWLFSPMIADWTGVVIGLLQFQLPELILIPGLILLASAVGYLPAMSAYRTDVAKSLITTP